MATINQILDQARAMGLEVHDTSYRAAAAGIGPYPETQVGPVLRSVRVVYGGAVQLEADPGADRDQVLGANPVRRRCGARTGRRAARSLPGRGR
jgi:hypothetical protein